MNFYEIALTRRSCRKYDPERAAEREKLDKILASARLAPSACNGQSYHISVCSGNAAKRVAAATQEKGMNKFTTDVPLMLVISEEPPCKGAMLGIKYKGLDYRQTDIGILAAYITCEATVQGLESCILGWFNEDEVKNICGVEGAVGLIVAIGYPHPEDKITAKVRKEIAELVTFIE